MRPIYSSKAIMLAIILLSVLILPMQSSAELVDRIVAVVNNEVITSTELDSTWEPILRQLRERIPAAKLEEALITEKKKVLEKKIDNLLISQEAETTKVIASEDEIDGAIERMAEKNRISVEAFHKEIKRSGIDLKVYRKDISDNIQRSKLIDRKINSKIVISEEKTKEYYEEVFTQKNTAEGYHLLQIGFTWGTSSSAAANKKDAEKRAGEIRKLVSEGQNFSELARSFSELPSAEDGGDLGFFKADEMSDSMSKVLIDLEPGKVSEVFEMSGAYQFYMILSVNLDGTTRFAPLTIFQNEISNLLFSEEQKKRYENWMEEIRSKSYIRTLL